MRPQRRRIQFAILALLTHMGLGESAQAQNRGFQLGRYEPTAAGEWSFLVDRPWYSSTRFFAAGLTLNYAHNPLVFGQVDAEGGFSKTESVIAHQLIGHLDLAGSFLDRVNLSFSMPLVLLERGTALAGITPAEGAYPSDLRFSAMGRLYGQPDKDKFSIHLGAQVWVPLRKFHESLPEQGSDQEVRVLPKVVVAGQVWRIRYGGSFGFLYRPESTIGMTDPVGSTVGSEIQIGAALGYVDPKRRFQVGPEMLLSTVVTSGHGFARDFTSLELLAGANYNLFSQVQIGLALGGGVLREPGTPDFRGLLRISYAPFRRPKNQPLQPLRIEPPKDQDRDGVPDESDVCPQVAQGKVPDRLAPGCPFVDRDGDGVGDSSDYCPDTDAGKVPDRARPGCPPLPFGRPAEPQKPPPPPVVQTVPAADQDGDGVADPEDQCLAVKAGPYPDPQKKGCPQPDQDGDTVPDGVDACPKEAGSPNPDPAKNGCAGLALIKNGQIAIVKPVFFAHDQDLILTESFPVLSAVGDVLRAQGHIKKVRIEGHTDGRGNPLYNVDLSDRRAKSVMRWLTENGIEPSRLEAVGHGPSRPLATNKTIEGRALNRRVEFHIVDPPSDKKVQVEPAKAAPKQADEKGKGKVGKGKGKGKVGKGKGKKKR